ncbi:MAG: tetratricopeptide repeat protein [Candidatus Omnitrophota bacterium]
MGLSLLMLPAVFAETVTLDNGKVLEGEVIELSDEFIRLETADGLYRVRMGNMSEESARYYREWAARAAEQETVAEGWQAMEEARPQDDQKAEKERQRQAQINADRFLAQAINAANEEDYERAVKLTGKAIALRPDSGKLRFFRGRFFMDRENYSAAVSDFSRAIDIRPDKAELYEYRARAYRELGQQQKSIEDFSRAIELDPRNIDYLAARGDLYRNIGEYDLAFADYSRAIRIAPNFAYAFARRASIYYERGDYKMAWRNVHSAEKRGFVPPEVFLDKLRAAMADPYQEPEPDQRPRLVREWQKLRSIVEDNQSFFLAVGILAGSAFFLLLIMMLIESVIVKKKHKLVQKKNQEQMLEEKKAEETAKAREEVAQILNEDVPIGYDFKKAGLTKRMCAFLFDAFLFTVMAWGVSVVLEKNLFALVFGLLILFKDAVRGRSPGKLLAGLQAVNEYGQPIMLTEGILRNFLLAAGFLFIHVLLWVKGGVVDTLTQFFAAFIGIMFLLESLSIVFSRRSGSRVGDYMASSRVHDRRPRWPAIIFIPWVLVFAGLFVGAAVLTSVHAGSSFVYSLIPGLYYHDLRDFYFRIPPGWEVVMENEQGVILQGGASSAEKQELPAVIISAEDALSMYPFDIGFSFIKQSLEDSGMKILEERDNKVAGMPAKQLALSSGDQVVLLACFKRGTEGAFYTIQGSAPKALMGKAAPQIVSVAESFQFALTDVRVLREKAEEFRDRAVEMIPVPEEK